MATIPVKAVANYFLELAEREDRTLTPMQLQKLCYFTHGWHLAVFGSPLLEERIEAWKYGPVISSLYREFKSFGGDPVRGRATETRLVGPQLVDAYIPLPDRDDPRYASAISLMKRVWDQYKNLSGSQLSRLTHQPGTPWWKVWNEQEGSSKRYLPIDDAEIRSHFVELARQGRLERQAQHATA